MRNTKMSLLKNAFTNRSKRKESLNKSNHKFLTNLTPNITNLKDPIEEPLQILGYKSSQSKVIHLKKKDLIIGIKGIRAFWGYLYGVNPSGSPKGISTLLEYINGVSNNTEVQGWSINKSTNKYKALLIHKPKCIKILTNDVEELLSIMNKVHPNDNNIWRISYKELNL